LAELREFPARRGTAFGLLLSVEQESLFLYDATHPLVRIGNLSGFTGAAAVNRAISAVVQNFATVSANPSTVDGSLLRGRDG
jgi:hypothetical protein